MKEATTLKLKILNTEIQAACAAHEKDALIDAARFVDDEMRSIKSKSGTRSVEKVAIITAMNLANELLQLRKESAAFSKASSKISDLNTKLATALSL